MKWAIDEQAIPGMLVGPAHGDLHGRNIIAGVVRGEAEWPAVFDFDKMKSENLVAWDFAKLEIELKCRLMPELLDSVNERAEAREWLGLPTARSLPADLDLNDKEQRTAQQAKCMELMFAIEKLLRGWTLQIYNSGQAARLDAEFISGVPEHSPLSRALSIIFRIRREAALVLGFDRPGRENAWRDEYYFALGTYGVVSAKWHSVGDHLAWSLLSAGVACAQLPQLKWPPDTTLQPQLESVASYLQVLPYAHACWKNGDWQAPVPLLRSATEKFDYAVALRQELALCLATSDDREDDEMARRQIESLAKKACIYRDHETLCRLGRIHKDKADRLVDDSLSHGDTIEKQLPPSKHYVTALAYYSHAFEISQSYYPGINVATLALLTGDEGLMNQTAEQVLALCATVPLDNEHYTWVLASQGEACLLLGRSIDALCFYRAAIDRILPAQATATRSLLDQLRRLQWALGSQSIQPILDLIGIRD